MIRLSPSLTLVTLLVVGCAVGTAPLPSGNGGSAPPEGDNPADESADTLVPGKNDGTRDAAAETESEPTDAGAKTDAKAVTDAKTDTNPPAAQDPCPGFAVPNDSSGACTACQTAGQPCQANGCYNGYYCELSTDKCRQKPSGC